MWNREPRLVSTSDWSEPVCGKISQPCIWASVSTEESPVSEADNRNKGIVWEKTNTRSFIGVNSENHRINSRNRKKEKRKENLTTEGTVKKLGRDYCGSMWYVDWLTQELMELSGIQPNRCSVCFAAEKQLGGDHPSGFLFFLRCSTWHQ